MPEVVEAPAPEVVISGAAPAENANPVQNPEGQAPSVVSENASDEPNQTEKTDEEKVTPEQAAKKGQARLERKLNKLYRERAEAQARADLLERQLQERTKVEQQPSGRPKFEEFNYDPEKYSEALEKWASENAVKSIEAKRTQEAQQAAQKALATSWEKKVARAEDKYDDFDTVVGDLKPTTPWAHAVIQADNGDDVAYHLGKNLAEAQRIAALDPITQILEIGRLSAKLAAAPPQKQVLSNAPKPITALQGGTGGAKGEPDINDTEKWIKWRQKQVRGG
jgi:hypothetical protein